MIGAKADAASTIAPAWTDARTEVEVGILGPLEVAFHGTEIVPTARKPRSLLALLVVNAGRIVTVGTINEELWDDDPPRSAAT